MKLIANRQLSGDYGRVVSGQEFEARDSIGEELIKRNLARAAKPPRIEYDTKVITPKETPGVSARDQFRNLPLPDQESPGLGIEGNSQLPSTDASTSGVVDRGRWGGRKGLAPKRGPGTTYSSSGVEAHR